MKLNYHFTKEDISNIKADIVAIGLRKRAGEEKKPGLLLKADGGIELNKRLDGMLERIIAEEELTGESGKVRIIHTSGKIGAKKVMLIGLGEEKEMNLDTLRIVGAKIAQVANELKAKGVACVIQPEKIKNLAPKDRVQAFAEGFILGGYRFEMYKDKKGMDKRTLETVILSFKGNNAPLVEAVSTGTSTAEAINYARDLVNMPGDDMTPNELAKEAQKICKAKSLSCTILDEAGIKKERMNLLLAVGRGAVNPPRFIHIKYTPPKKAKAKVAIIGKGITFDSGGYNLKPTRHIENMKSDMAGAATVLAAMRLLPVLKPDIAVDGYIPATENMIDGHAHKPGDVIVSRSGKSVELINMDAEGRLILADAIDYAIERKPDVLIDIATLTGGVLYALGEIYTALLGNDQKLINKLLAASEEGGEPTWQIPLVKDYLKGLKEGIADLNNNGKSSAITITGALFLNEFVGKTKWAHFDIAESSWSKEDRDYRSKGGTGTGVQTLIKFLTSY